MNERETISINVGGIPHYDFECIYDRNGFEGHNDELGLDIDVKYNEPLTDQQNPQRTAMYWIEALLVRSHGYFKASSSFTVRKTRQNPPTSASDHPGTHGCLLVP